MKVQAYLTENNDEVASGIAIRQSMKASLQSQQMQCDESGWGTLKWIVTVVQDIGLNAGGNVTVQVAALIRALAGNTFACHRINNIKQALHDGFCCDFL